ncbi:25S rRNA (adenine645-N1)-methyltransferase [Loxospora ochrophaea]|nr:25S rRNA (adenine645-N1)-methyltransferase [Loxospora ochrophaea]
MFAVPGWSVSADVLKTQTKSSDKTADNQKSSTRRGSANSKPEKSSKKRKRDRVKTNGLNVTAENLGDLWTKHIEGRNASKEDEQESTENPKTSKKKRKKDAHNLSAQTNLPTVSASSRNEDGVDPTVDPKMPKKKHKQESHGATETKTDKPSVTKLQAHGEAVGDESTRTAEQEQTAGNATQSEKREKKRKSREVGQDKIGSVPSEENKATVKARFEERKARKEEKRQRKALQQTNSEIPPSKSDDSNAPQPLPTSPIGSKKNLNASVPSLSTQGLTPLQTTMREKLISARFRHLNETLYTSSSVQAVSLFASDPTFYNDYHDGFRRQVSAWPENPVDGFVRWIEERGSVGREDQLKPKKKKPKKQSRPEPLPEISPFEPLPRNLDSEICNIVDLGCGDASLARALSTATPPKKAATDLLDLSIQSFDLSAKTGLHGADNPLVTVADIRHLQLDDNSADIAIFCLSLMGTNWIEFIEEAWRVLRWGGECWIAEVRSRFVGPKPSTGTSTSDAPPSKKPKKPKHKSSKPTPVDPDASDTAYHSPLEEIPATSSAAAQLTALGPFIDVVLKRGFILLSEPDVGNRMFVRMRFVKGTAPKRGIRAPGGKRQIGRFIDEEGEDESSVLKPCVYKKR